jgi:hypothetical protein
MLKHFGIIGMIGFLVTSLIISAINWQDASLTISQHISLRPETTVVFSLINTITAILVTFCLLLYVGPKWRLGLAFSFTVAVLAIGLFSVGWFPRSGDSANIHQFMAWLVIGLIVVVSAMLLAMTWRHSNRPVKACGLALLGFVALMLSTKLLTGTWYDQNVFYFETVYFIAFFTFVLSLNYSQVKSVS